MSCDFLLLLLIGSSYAATHVNISIAQHPADVKYIEGSAPAELRAGPAEHHADFSYREEAQQSARLRQAEQKQQQHQQQQQEMVQQFSQSSSQPQARVQLQSSNGPQLGVAVSNNNARINLRRRGPQQQRRVNSQFRQRTQQDKQNQEFERYIQSYHGGPTVETVFESSSPAPLRQHSKSMDASSTSSISSSSSSSSSSAAADAAPQRVVEIGARSKQVPQFERQIALPQQREYSASSSANLAQDVKPIYEAQPSAPAPVGGATVTTSSSSSSSSNTATTATVSPPRAAAPAFDSATSYNKPSYDYDDTQDFHDQYPPSVDAAAGYDDYSDQSNLYDQPVQAPGYLPPARPLVTKTIQIVQPALKAKKYEVRHPAIQKEFYDIEERVVIKPAGTLVVELDHPVKKIAKGETLLPLGHPHPAVASAYHTNNDAAQSQPSTNSYSSNQQSAYAPKQQAVTTVGSSVTTMPSYDQSPKDDYVESKLRQPYNAVDDRTNQRGEVLLATDSNGHQAQINSKQLSPKQIVRVEPSPTPVDVQQNVPSYAPQYEPSARVEQRNYGYSSNNMAQYPENLNNEPDDYFTGEYFDSNARAEPQDAKPARIQQAVEPEARTTHVIKHEHNIHIPPAQHNIYLSRSTQLPQPRPISEEEEELPARVSEVRPYLQRHQGGTVVYARPVLRSAGQLRRLQPSYNYRQSEPARYRAPLRAEAEPVEYSAPYSHMRFEPAETSARYSQPRQESARLVEELPNARQESVVASKPRQAHIQIQIPHHSESHKPIVVSSTISPPLEAPRKANLRDSSPDREVESVSELRGDQSFGQVRSKADCDQPDGAPARYVQETKLYRNLRPAESRTSNYNRQQQFQRLVEVPSTQASHATSANSANVENVKPENIDVSLKSAAGHMTPNSRVIAATPAPTDAAASSETFHKRRIVVNHPFQTVREVVEHEPVTNYHQIQVNEPAMPAVYHHQHQATASYYQPSTHGNLVYQQQHSIADHGHFYY